MSRRFCAVVPQTPQYFRYSNSESSEPNCVEHKSFPGCHVSTRCEYTQNFSNELINLKNAFSGLLSSQNYRKTNCDSHLDSLVYVSSNSLQNGLRWLKTVSSSYIWMGRHKHSLSLDATIIVSKNCPIIGEHVVITFLTQQVTIATV